MIFEKSSELFEVYGECAELIGSLMPRTQIIQTSIIPIICLVLHFAR